MKNLLTLLFVSVAFLGAAQTDSVLFDGFDDSPRGKNGLRIMFYNVENLFDIYDDSLKNDESFTPDGNNHWSNYKYWEKQNNISKVILAAGGWEPVDIVGLCEVENLKVLNDLTQKTSLASSNYTIVHQESPDKRGIDVALLYQKEKLTLDTAQWIQVFLGDGQRPTRDVLFATFTTLNNEQLHVFVNHWPSRYGGQMASDPKRRQAANTVRLVVDSILTSNANANILLMGDFNDEPENGSIKENLRATHDSTFAEPQDLYNMMSHIRGNNGTHKYQGTWGVLDQFMVSQGLYQGHAGLQVTPGPLVFKAPFLLIDETKYPGIKPYRTFIGMKYQGGYSDHLPIYVDLQLLN
jgi:predicted extracellular nuclease